MLHRAHHLIFTSLKETNPAVFLIVNQDQQLIILLEFVLVDHILLHYALLVHLRIQEGALVLQDFMME